MRKIVTVVGARPQFVKAAAFSRVWRAAPDRSEILVHTGQHYDDNMSDIFFRELGIPQPDYHLGVGSSSHGKQTGKMLEAIEEVIVKEKPDALLVYGDTNSTLAGALAAAKLHVPVAHVEAGLRSFNKRMPEELNRVLTDHVSTFLFVPNHTAVQNLMNEGFAEMNVSLVGDVMLDIARMAEPLAEKHSRILESLKLERKGYAVATIHRAENTDVSERLELILQAMSNLSRDLPIVLPLHPRTKHIIERRGGTSLDLSRLHIIDPVGYLDMLNLTRHAAIVVTDSGGLQKEAYFQRVPCLTLRDETEWTELVDAGWNQLLKPADGTLDLRTAAQEAVSRCRDLPWTSIYGDGNSAEKIVNALVRSTI